MNDGTSAVLRFFLQREAWMAESECRKRGLGPNDFVLERGQSSKPAKSACAACPVSKECSDYAERTGSTGIWGGEIRKTAAPRQIQDARPRPAVAPEPEMDDLPWPIEVQDARPKAS